MALDPKDYEYTQDDLDNYSGQLNPTSDVYWQSRDEEERPDDWEIRTSNDN